LEKVIVRHGPVLSRIGTALHSAKCFFSFRHIACRGIIDSLVGQEYKERCLAES
jgi:hypothetical protein